MFEPLCTKRVCNKLCYTVFQIALFSAKRIDHLTFEGAVVRKFFLRKCVYSFSSVY